MRESLRQFHVIARHRFSARHGTNKRTYDQKLNESSYEYVVGEQVLLHRVVAPNGQFCKFLSPYHRAVILEKNWELSTIAYGLSELQNVDGTP